MILYPDFYYDSVADISLKTLEENNIKGLILDVDNTLIDYQKNLDEKIIKWVDELKKNDIKFCIVSNSNKREKVKAVAEKLDIPYFYFAKKPLKFGFRKAKLLLNLEFKNIAAVGDQILTDVIGANRCGMFSILVKPIHERDILITRVKRPIEKCIINKYLSKVQKEKE